MAGEPEALGVYYDSFFPMEVAERGRLAAYSRDLFSRIRRGPYAVAISQVVVGETHAVLMGRYADHARRMESIGRLHAAFQETGVYASAGAHGGLRPIDPKKIMGVMGGLLRRVPELDGTDLVILAVALADPYSAYLFTRDRMLVGNDKIMAYEEDLRKKERRIVRLQITDMVRPARRSPARPGR